MPPTSSFCMDVDAAWCPACDRLIQPKRFLINVPVMPPAPPPSPARHRFPKQGGGLVSGTGRLKHLKQHQPQVKQRLVIDDGPIPLYCSDACQLADLKARQSDAPTDPAREEATATPPPQPQPQHDDPDRPLTSREQFAKMYNITIPPPPPVIEDPRAGMPPREYTGGIIMAGRFISSMCPKPAKPKEAGRYPSPPEPTKIVPGWNDGSSAWRSAVYNFMPQSPGDPFYQPPTPPKPRFRPNPHRPSSSAPAGPSPLENEEMIAKFSEQFKHSRTQSSTIRPAPLKKERSLVQRGAEGKLLVPDVKLKVRCGSNASIPSNDPTSPAPSTRRSSKSRLSAPSRADLPEQDICTSFTLRRPTVESEFICLSDKPSVDSLL